VCFERVDLLADDYDQRLAEAVATMKERLKTLQATQRIAEER
jgi:hypothetical protein